MTTLAGTSTPGQIRAFMRAFPHTRRIVGLAVLLGLAAMAVPASSPAQQESGDGGGLIGLTLPLGARIVGQGRAAVAAAGELQALPYNPATAVGLEQGGLTFSRFEAADAAELSSNYLAGAWVSRWGTVAGHLVLHDFGEITVTDDSPDRIGTIDVAEWVIGATYANRWREKLSYGATAKLYTSDLGETEGTTAAFDLGLVYTPRRALPLDFAVSLRNLGPDLEYDDPVPANGAGGAPQADAASQRLPSRVRVGVAFHPDRFLGLPEGYAVTLYGDTESDLEELSTTNLHAGASVVVREVVVLRAGGTLADNPYIGAGDGDREAGGSFGIGVRYGGFEADVAREISVSELGDETHFAVGWRF